MLNMAAVLQKTACPNLHTWFCDFNSTLVTLFVFGLTYFSVHALQRLHPLNQCKTASHPNCSVKTYRTTGSETESCK